MFDALLPHVELQRSHQVVGVGAKHYVVLTDLLLKDHEGLEVGKVVVAREITGIIRAQERYLFEMNTVTVILAFAAFGLLYFVLSHYVRTLSDTQRTLNSVHRQKELYKSRARSDALTGLYNRSHFEAHLRRMIETEQKGALLFLDLDHFKRVNDSFGHDVGDAVLVQFARHLKVSCRASDVSARWGGEEFALMLKDADEKDGCKRAQALLDAIAADRFEHGVHMTTSIGVTTIRPDDTVHTLIKRADTLLYAAKEAGRNRCICDL